MRHICCRNQLSVSPGLVRLLPRLQSVLWHCSVSSPCPQSCCNSRNPDSKVKANPDDAAIDLPGLSETVANLTLYYENNNFSARVNTRYRDDFLGEVSGFGGGRNLRLVKEETIVDAQIGWTFTGDNWTNGLTIYAQGFNLTDEPFVTFNKGDARQVIDYQRYGKSYLVGATYHF